MQHPLLYYRHKNEAICPKKHIFFYFFHPKVQGDMSLEKKFRTTKDILKSSKSQTITKYFNQKVCEHLQNYIF